MEERIKNQKYYKLPNGMEAIDVARYLDFNLGNVVKYCVRCGRKEELGMSSSEKKLEDLKKAKVYLEDEIAMLEDSI